MPTCKNHPNRYYKGTEPSPKGRGFCASGEKIGTTKKGKDNTMWIVQKNGKTQRWVRKKSKRDILNSHLVLIHQLMKKHNQPNQPINPIQNSRQLRKHIRQLLRILVNVPGLSTADKRLLIPLVSMYDKRQMKTVQYLFSMV